MTTRTSSSFAYLAPGASGYASIVFPGASERPFPPVDEHVVQPETRQEMIDGRIVHVAPALAPHAVCHTRLGYLLGASVAPGYVGTLDLLTRTSEDWNFAADGAVLKQGKDPATGHRYLEELAFEIKYTQSLSEMTDRARQLANRGVRRVFMICVSDLKPRRDGEDPDEGKVDAVMEWCAADKYGEGRWIELAPDTVIEDPCLHTPLSVRAIMDVTAADDTVLRALAARHNPALQQVTQVAEARGFERGEAQGFERGEAQGFGRALRQALVSLCRALDIELTPARQTALDTMDADGLQALLDRITAQRCWDV